MRTSSNRQTVSSTSRWNMAQSDLNSPGAQKRPFKNQQTGQGSNLPDLKRALVVAELHFAQTSDPRLMQNMAHGILLLKAQIARLVGGDVNAFDLTHVQDSPTGYVFAGLEDSDDFNGTTVVASARDQSPISSFAQFQLWGTLRQKITKVGPPTNATIAGYTDPSIPDPSGRSNVLRNVDNPNGSTYRTGVPGSPAGLVVEKDTRDERGWSGVSYQQGITPETHGEDLMKMPKGMVTSSQHARGKHGQLKHGYTFGM